MSMQATDRDDKRQGALADIKATAKKPPFFKMRAQMLDQTRSNTALAASASKLYGLDRAALPAGISRAAQAAQGVQAVQAFQAAQAAQSIGVAPANG